jgi:hypothetical protein
MGIPVLVLQVVCQMNQEAKIMVLAKLLLHLSVHLVVSTEISWLYRCVLSKPPLNSEYETNAHKKFQEGFQAAMARVT